MKMKSQVVSLIVLGILSASANVCNGVVEYQMIDISLLSGKPGTARAINDKGQIVGYWGQLGTVGSSGGCRAFLYDNGMIENIDLTPGHGNAAYGINNNGEIVGWRENAGHRQAGLYEDGAWIILGDGLNGHWSEARGINNAGQIVGFSDFGTWDSYQTKYAFLYQDGVATKLWMLGGQALGINNIGEVVGWLQIATGGGRAFVWRDGTMTQLGTLGYSSAARAINDNGLVVGDSKLDPSLYHAFLYEDGVMKDLGTLGGNSSAQAINNKGQIVGYSYADDGTHAFLYDNGVMTDLGFGAAYGINDNGWIVGESVGHAVVWVPEPATVLLFGLGALALRKRKYYHF